MMLSYLRNPLVAALVGGILSAAAVLATPAVKLPIVGTVFHGGALARLAALRTENDRLGFDLGLQTAATAVSEGLRVEDRSTAQDDAAAAALRCDARVDRALRDGAAINDIANQETAYDATGCPVRALIGNDRLRALFDPDPDAGAAGVPAQPDR